MAEHRLKPGLRAWLLLVLVFGRGLFAAEVIPPAPRDHFNDYAGIVRRETATQLNRELMQFERDTSNQIIVAIYPRLQSNSSVEDYTVRVAQRWAVGQKERKNGAVLFLFQESHDIRIQVGYGLEGVLPDALCKRIIENELVPRFRAGDFDAGVIAGVHALLAATRGEYRGTGRTLREGDAGSGANAIGSLFAFAILALIVIGFLKAAKRRTGTVYSPGGRRTIWAGNSPWGGWGGGGGSWGGGGSAGGGGTFSGGGGSFGGGGAGGKW